LLRAPYDVQQNISFRRLRWFQPAMLRRSSVPLDAPCVLGVQLQSVESIFTYGSIFNTLYVVAFGLDLLDSEGSSSQHGFFRAYNVWSRAIESTTNHQAYKPRGLPKCCVLPLCRVLRCETSTIEAVSVHGPLAAPEPHLNPNPSILHLTSFNLTTAHSNFLHKRSPQPPTQAPTPAPPRAHFQPLPNKTSMSTDANISRPRPRARARNNLFVKERTFRIPFPYISH
jgi:hypothetical protein